MGGGRYVRNTRREGKRQAVEVPDRLQASRYSSETHPLRDTGVRRSQVPHNARQGNSEPMGTQRSDRW